MANFKEKLAATKAAVADANKAHKQALLNYFQEGAKEVFNNYPEVENFSWTQYTPYWCDGEQCEFSAHTDQPEVNGEEVSCYNWTGGKKIPIQTPEAEQARAVKEFLKSFTESDYESMFGDHVKVTVTKEGVETEEYEHD